MIFNLNDLKDLGIDSLEIRTDLHKDVTLKEVQFIATKATKGGFRVKKLTLSEAYISVYPNDAINDFKTHLNFNHEESSDN